MSCSAGCVLVWDTNREDGTVCVQQRTLHVQEGRVLINGHSADLERGKFCSRNKHPLVQEKYGARLFSGSCTVWQHWYSSGSLWQIGLCDTFVCARVRSGWV